MYISYTTRSANCTVWNLHVNQIFLDKQRLAVVITKEAIVITTLNYWDKTTTTKKNKRVTLCGSLNHQGASTSLIITLLGEGCHPLFVKCWWRVTKRSHWRESLFVVKTRFSSTLTLLWAPGECQIPESVLDCIWCGGYYSWAATTLGLGLGLSVAPEGFGAALLSGTGKDERWRALEAASFVFATESLTLFCHSGQSKIFTLLWFYPSGT